MIKIIDDFLPEEEFLNIKNLMESREFPWYFNRSKIFIGDNKGQHVHVFFKHGQRNSEYLEMWNNFMRKIEATK